MRTLGRALIPLSATQWDWKANWYQVVLVAALNSDRDIAEGDTAPGFRKDVTPLI